MINNFDSFIISLYILLYDIIIIIIIFKDNNNTGWMDYTLAYSSFFLFIYLCLFLLLLLFSFRSNQIDYMRVEFVF